MVERRPLFMERCSANYRQPRATPLPFSKFTPNTVRIQGPQNSQNHLEKERSCWTHSSQFRLTAEPPKTVVLA